LDQKNKSMQAFIYCTPENGSSGVLGEAIVLNGTTPTNLAFSNLSNVANVNSAPDVQGTDFAETTDYTVDLVLGTVTRVGGGAIGDGATVYVTYNRTDMVAAASTCDVLLKNCTVQGQRFVENGITYNDVEIGLMVEPSRGISVAPNSFSAGGWFHYRDVPELLDLRYDLNLGIPMQHLNGVVRIEDCEFKDLTFAWDTEGLEGVSATPGGHTYPAGSVDRSLFMAKRVKMERIGIDNLTLWSCIHGINSGLDIVYDDCVWQTNGAVFQMNSSAEDSSSAHLAGWVGESNSLNMTNCRALDIKAPPGQFGIFNFQPVLIFGFGGSIPNRASSISGCEFEFTGPLVDFWEIIIFSPVSELSFNNNKIRTSRGHRVEQAPVRVNDGTVSLMGNDFSDCQINPGHSAIRIGGGGVDCTIHAEPNDMIEDQGTGTKITGGTLSTTLH